MKNKSEVGNSQSAIRGPQSAIGGPQSVVENGELDRIEMDALLEAVHRWWGYDFRNYAPASLKRRILRFLEREKLSTISGLQEKALHDRECLERLLLEISVNVTAMFREPTFFIAFREFVVPFLKTYPFVRIWCAGCSTGEEAYSLAILLQEEEILDRCELYATDMNESVLKKARGGIYPLSLMKEYTGNYIAARGTEAFSDYYTSSYDNAIFDPKLKKKIVWAQHNLVTDASFNEFHVIVCRNVMIYFNKMLQDQAHRLFYDSLIPHGILGLGEKETIRFSPYEKQYEEIEAGRKLFRRTG